MVAEAASADPAGRADARTDLREALARSDLARRAADEIVRSAHKAVANARERVSRAREAEEALRSTRERRDQLRLELKYDSTPGQSLGKAAASASGGG